MTAEPVPAPIPVPPPLRRHQRLALDALAVRWAAGATRAWVVLPPGAGKTRVGLETALAAVAEGHRAVVLGPNTAIQAQWLAQARAMGLDASDDRDLGAALTALTYQSLAVFDADAEPVEGVDEPEPESRDEALLERLHPHGRALVEALREAGPLLLVLDECHHLLEVWGRLLAELLALLPRARVLGLTATPPETLTRDQANLVADLFGDIAYATSIPAVVREGDLAPFAELVQLVQPTAAERDWLAGDALRFTELTTALVDPTLGTVPFLTWLDRRLVTREGVDGRPGPAWPALARREPDLARAGLRLHHAGLLALPEGARPGEEHRREPAAEDWVVLLDDWVRGHLRRSDAAEDAALLDRIRAALPAVGHTLTRHGVRRGRTPVDRVLARSEAKTTACVTIARHERANLGDDARVLVLCDHERASATLPADLEGVLDQQSGSAWAVLEALLADPATEDVLLVSGSAVAGAPATLTALAEHAAAQDLRLAGALEVVPAVAGGGRAASLEGRWSSRRWVRHVTTFLEAGGTHVLVGTRGLLGEGWDARCLTTLVDLTAVTTTTAVVQTRGRALRTDPQRPEKVALTWTVVCVDPEHPRGDADWQRLVRKHTGFFGVDAEGEVVDGVAHLDPVFSPFAPPPVAEHEAVNARMLVAAEGRADVRERWRVGEPYADRVGRTLRVLPGRTVVRSAEQDDLDRHGRPQPAAVAVRAGRLEPRSARVQAEARRATTRFGQALGGGLSAGTAATVGLTAAASAAGAPSGLAPVIVSLAAAAGVTGAGVGLRTHRRRRGAALLGAVDGTASTVPRVAAAVADALGSTGLVPGASAERVSADVDPDGTYRCVLGGADEAGSEVFTRALADALGPVSGHRYALRRHVLAPGSPDADEAVAERSAGRRGHPVPTGTVWHPVPTDLGVHGELARAYGDALERWVGCEPPVFLARADPAVHGELAAQGSADPFDVTTVVRRRWE
ncbi:DEAD/DEAH box helicase family protein [Nocardioides bruguierae]|uniref:DEAD/DEAH box helicase family protein n=1 Tax=Nocardioides bruguierae TaxID=2945102 RepID=A0A9X2IDP0_9ACTN|nr:DEAD/DEAH box helicase family protein [Nocardioides bruguierae]MCM0619462.1 DEAD/DEAH box helicase family protein [Nocardioides bruguierae]